MYFPYHKKSSLVLENLGTIITKKFYSPALGSSVKKEKTEIYTLQSELQQDTCLILTQLSLASLLLDIGKQNSPRCDAAERSVPSGAILFAKKIFIEK